MEHLRRSVAGFPSASLFVLLLLLVHSVFAGLLEDQHFWHITDFHYDPLYRTHADPNTMCHKEVAAGASSSQFFGDYLCDAPMSLLESALQFVASKQAAKFILYTGDNSPHFPTDQLDWPSVYNNTRTATQLFKRYLSNVTLIPMLGNHDFYPRSQAPSVERNETNGSVYSEIAELWSDHLDEENRKTFIRGGYYVKQIETKVQLVIFNSNLYYSQDKLTANSVDPCDQFEWLSQLFIKARQSEQKIVLVGHVPPGYFERAKNFSWFYPKFNERYNSLILDNCDVIATQIFGHQHSDSFKLFFHENGTICNSLMLSPSVTPWQSPLPGVTANNPSLRLYSYQVAPDQFNMKYYEQYFLNLKEANKKEVANWGLLYATNTDPYMMKSLSASDWTSLFFRMKTNSSLFQTYFARSSVGYDTGGYSAYSRKNHLCAIARILSEDFDDCMFNMFGEFDSTLVILLVSTYFVSVVFALAASTAVAAIVYRLKPDMYQHVAK